MMKKLTPNLMVDNVNTTVEFYMKNLGFELVVTVPETGQFNWVMMKSGNIEIMFQAAASLGSDLPDMKGRKVGGTFLLYIDVQDIKKLRSSLKSDVSIIKDLQKTFYGTEEFTIRDINGYYLTFAGGGQ